MTKIGRIWAEKTKDCGDNFPHITHGEREKKIMLRIISTFNNSCFKD